MQINKISNMTFKNTINTKSNNTESAILMLRDPNASIKFQKSQEYALKADSIDTNPIIALGYKLYRTFNLIINNNENIENKKII